MHAVVINCLFVGIGGFFGAIFRSLFSLIPFPLPSAWSFPVHTFLVNLIGSVLIGAIAAVAQTSGSFDQRFVCLFQVGLCGGFTTFSTFALECNGMLANGAYGTFAIYAIASVVLCVAGVALGHWAALRIA